MIILPSTEIIIYKKYFRSFALSDLFIQPIDQIYNQIHIYVGMNERKHKYHYVNQIFKKSNARLTWISNFQPLTASSVRILVNDIVSPSRKNRWQASLLTSRPKKRGKKINVNKTFLWLSYNVPLYNKG